MLLLALLLGSCSSDEDPGAPPAAAVLEADADVELPSDVVVPEPEEVLVDMAVVEDSSEAVANQFVDFADKLRRRDFTAARRWLSPEFVGDALAGMPVQEEETLPLGARRVSYDVGAAEVVRRSGFLDSLSARLAEWEHVEAVVWKVKGAEFALEFPAWGRVRTQITLLGSSGDGGPRSVVAWAWVRVDNVAGSWRIAALELTSLEELARDRFLFTDVATSAGVAHSGIRFGQPGNQSFAWNGAAAGDVDGDGLWDLFVPSAPRNFLYLGRSGDLEGAVSAFFEDEAEERGVSRPAGGTGAVFLDFDNDGDQDLFLADVGWRGGGNPLRLWRNDGKGFFAEVGKELGFGDPCDGYSLVAFDAEQDGWVDLFVCNYGRVSVQPNDSWIQATNGTPNRFYRNLEGKGFRECAAERGLVDTDWSYAAAAADFDLDGDQDLYVANDYGRNQLWINDGQGRFEEAAAAMGVQDLGNGMGCAWGDLDGDGALDLYVSNMSSTAGNRILSRLKTKDDTWSYLKKLAAGNSIFLADAGRENGGFRLCPPEMGGIGGSWAWSPSLFDLDLDGRLDVYCCSGFVTGNTPADT